MASPKVEVRKCCKNFRMLCGSTIFIWSLIPAMISGVFAVMLYVLDHDLEHDFLKDYNPDPVVFNVFVVFASLVAAFRTSHALGRYTDAAAMMHKLSACWSDSASTLVAFCRGSTAVEAEVNMFQETMVRMISLLNALCLDVLEDKESDFESGHCFEVIGWQDLNETIHEGLQNNICKVEYAFQAIQALVVDAMRNQILCVPPPLLTRSIQELGAGMLTFHEAKKLSCVPLPFAYLFITRVILVGEAVFVPFILAGNTQGAFSSFLFTFFGTFMLWFINGVAETLDNPFKKEAGTLETGDLQVKLNVQLRELVRNSSAPTPSLRFELPPRVRRRSAAASSFESVKDRIGGQDSRMFSEEVSAPPSGLLDPSPGSLETTQIRHITSSRSSSGGRSSMNSENTATQNHSYFWTPSANRRAPTPQQSASPEVRPSRSRSGGGWGLFPRRASEQKAPSQPQRGEATEDDPQRGAGGTTAPSGSKVRVAMV